MATPRQRRLLNEHSPTNSMNGSAFDQPLCAVVNPDPTARPPAALPVEVMAPSDLPNGAEAQAAQLAREGYLVISGCLSASRVDDVKQLLDETAAKGATEAIDSEYRLESVFNLSPSYLPLLDQVSLGVVRNHDSAYYHSLDIANFSKARGCAQSAVLEVVEIALATGNGETRTIDSLVSLQRHNG